MIPVTEKRLHPRIDLAVPVKLVEEGPGGRERVMVGNAVSLNVSARGIYLRTFTSYPLMPGMYVELRITVPEFLMAGSAPESTGSEYLHATLSGRGKILRVERVITADVIGVGVAIEFDRPLEFARGF
jgi:hypothetical protein